ncbi:beta-glucosidase [Paenibacillus sp. CAA11]|uniref:glycoside hydrolase family 3 protein n=1 Tax=Paenibacillus sp. CAA11 TaxID=1532905 RepID=UPI000D393BD5|nr:glycoside hydrolase family 3 protein [Paenibacillus sp. CAA11]AWB45484.1 beta-glucosidase [Paenibacillus sp. CAA11]
MNSANAYPFRNPDLPLEQRVADLVSRFTLEEKIELMCQYQAEIPRLGVLPYKHGTEGAHGVAWLGEATVFPQNTGLACTWDPDLMGRIGAVIGDEARIYYQKNPAINGLTVWAPTVDMERDPRWGRTEEAYGEDPYLTGRLSTELVKGMQGPDPFYYKTVATLKHFYGNNNEIDRGSASVSIDPRNKREYYLKAFEPAFREGGAASMMTAYNAVNGVPCNLNSEINEIVKGEWSMNGFVVGDAGDVLGTVNDHAYVQSYAEAVARSVKSGIDSITDDQEISFRALRDALEQGLLEEADLDRALHNTFRVRFRLGEFDPADRNPYAHVDEAKLCAPEHAELSLTAARESIVLLKNEGLLPLKADKLGSAAVIGPLGDEVLTDWYSGTPAYRITPLEGIRSKLEGKAVHAFDGSDRVILRCAATGKYVGIHSEPAKFLAVGVEAKQLAPVFRLTDWGWGSFTLRADDSGKFVTETEEGLLAASADEARGWFVKEILQLETDENGFYELKNWQGRSIVMNEQGQLIVAPHADRADAPAAKFVIEKVADGIEEAVRAVKAADTAIVVVGNIPFINGKEEIDRPDITLPAAQQELIRAVQEASPNTVVLLVGSYPFAINWEQEHVPAILYSSHAGQEHGRAIADVLFGEYNPAGRLPMTWYRSVEQLPDFMDYDIIKGKRTYQYFEEEALYPFGHGLSYSSFEYSQLQLSSPALAADGSLTVTVEMKNTSKLAGDEVVQLYVRANQSRIPRPLKTLRGFRRVHMDSGAAVKVEFTLTAADLMFWDVTRDRYALEAGTYTVLVGSSSGDIRAEASFEADGEVIPPRSLQGWVKAVNYDDYEGIYLDECTEGGSSIRCRRESGWAAFKDVDFGEKGASQFTARVSSASPNAGIELRLDHADGPLVKSCAVPRTGGAQAWTTLNVPLEGLQGRQDLYVVLIGSVLLSRFSIE